MSTTVGRRRLARSGRYVFASSGATATSRLRRWVLLRRRFVKHGAAYIYSVVWVVVATRWHLFRLERICVASMVARHHAGSRSVIGVEKQSGTSGLLLFGLLPRRRVRRVRVVPRVG